MADSGAACLDLSTRNRDRVFGIEKTQSFDWVLLYSSRKATYFSAPTSHDTSYTFYLKRTDMDHSDPLPLFQLSSEWFPQGVVYPKQVLIRKTCSEISW